MSERLSEKWRKEVGENDGLEERTKLSCADELDERDFDICGDLIIAISDVHCLRTKSAEDRLQVILKKLGG